jgi:hypothetical protein
VVAENSATHCGDGFFGFAGQEALGGVAPPEGFEHAGKGNNGNHIWGNDFSYAAAHGLEMTFSFDNWIHSNRFVGNAICGIWGGYARETTIAENLFERNGDAGYGLERGGVNIEHGLGNRIEGNRFTANACGVHLWLDDDPHLASLPWVGANGDGSEGLILRNTFTGDSVAIHLRGSTRATLASGALANRYAGVAKELETEGGATAQELPLPALGTLPSKPSLPGTSRPFGARAALAGRDKIQLDEWGPIEPALPPK